jgi:hypothetical protein
MTEITYRGYRVWNDRAGRWVAGISGSLVESSKTFGPYSSLNELQDRIDRYYGIPERPVGHKSRVYPLAGVALGALAWIVLIFAGLAFQHWVFG